MTLNEAFEQSKPGDRLRHEETQLVLVRQAFYMDTIKGMCAVWFDRTAGDGWTVVKPGKVRQ
jgi:hypothetical protein